MPVCEERNGKGVRVKEVLKSLLTKITRRNTMKITAVLPAVMFFATVLISPGIAQASDTFPFVDFYSVLNNLDTTPQDVFTLAQTPYIYANIATSTSLTGWSIWFDNSDPALLFGNPVTLQNGQNWIPVPLSVSTVDGKWTAIASVSELPSVIPFVDSTVFTMGNGGGVGVVTPEPAAMALFAMGGIPLGLSFLRRRREVPSVLPS
jgi:hypothetical protein